MEILIRAGVFYPVTAPPLENGWLLVREGRVTLFGAGLIPDAENVIDLSGCLVMPGLVARYAASQRPTAWMPETDTVRELRELVRHRDALVNDFTRINNRLENCRQSAAPAVVAYSTPNHPVIPQEIVHFLDGS